MTDREELELAAKAAGIEGVGGYYWAPDGEAWNPLPADIARCAGYGAAECNTCRRFIDPPHDRQTWTGPWELEGVPCEMRIPICTTQSTTPSTTPRTPAASR